MNVIKKYSSLAAIILFAFFSGAILFSSGLFRGGEISAAPSADSPFTAKRINKISMIKKYYDPRQPAYDEERYVYIDEVRGKWIKVRELKKERMDDPDPRPTGDGYWLNTDYVTYVSADAQ